MIKADQPIKFDMNLTFFDEIVPENSTWVLQSVGRMYLNITKKQSPSKWKRLLLTEEKSYNMQIWWEMRERFVTELDNFGGKDEDEDDDSSKKKKKKKNQKNKGDSNV